MSRVNLVVPITPRRAWGNGRLTPGMRLMAASPIVRMGRTEAMVSSFKDRG